LLVVLLGGEEDCYCVGQQNLLSNGVCGKRFDTWLEHYDDVVDHKYVFSNMGYNLKPLDLQGSVGSVQLLKFDEIHNIRRDNKERIQKIIEKIPGTRVVNERTMMQKQVGLVFLLFVKIKP
jgi:CDP-6-deoxy-D-xylo-4-hexulose-3-dehydrase